jgi:hypothetical protein
MGSLMFTVDQVETNVQLFLAEDKNGQSPGVGIAP